MSCGPHSPTSPCETPATPSNCPVERDALTEKTVESRIFSAEMNGDGLRSLSRGVIF